MHKNRGLRFCSMRAAASADADVGAAVLHREKISKCCRCHFGVSQIRPISAHSFHASAHLPSPRCSSPTTPPLMEDGGSTAPPTAQILTRAQQELKKRAMNVTNVTNQMSGRHALCQNLLRLDPANCFPEM